MDLSSGRLFRGTLFHSVNFLLGSVLLPLLITTYMVRSVGDQVFGSWALMLTLGSWFMFADLGLSLGVPRFVGAAAATGDRARLGALFGTFAACYLLLCAVSGLVIWRASPWLLATFVKSSSPEDLITLRLIFCIFLTMVGWRGLRGFLDGVQQIEASSKVGLVIACLQAGGIAAALYDGRGLLAVAAIMLGCSVLQLLGFLLVLYRSPLGAGRFPVRLRLPDRLLLGRLLGFGLILYLTQLLANLLISDRLYLGWADVSRTLIANYHLAAVLVGKLAAMMITFSVALYPAAASLTERQEDQRLREMALRGLKFHVIVGGMLFSLLVAFTPQIFVLWMGERREQAVLFARLLTPWGFTSVITCLTAIGAGVGRPGLQLKSSVLSVVFAAGLFGLLVVPYGAVGLAATVSLSVIIVALIYIRDFSRQIVPLGARELWIESLLKPLGSCLVIVIPWGVVQGIERHWHVAEGRLSCLLLLALATLIFLACYLALGRRVGLLDREDTARLRAWGRALRGTADS